MGDERIARRLRLPVAGAARETLLLARAMEGSTLAVAIVRPDGAVALSEVAAEDASRGEDRWERSPPTVVRRGWARGPGEYELVIAVVSPGDVPRRLRVPLRMTDEIEHVVVEIARDRVSVMLLEPAIGIEIGERTSDDVELAIHNRSDRAVRGVGVPSGWFDGELVEARRLRWAPRSRRYCGTGAFDQAPLQPGETGVTAPSPWAMRDAPRGPLEPGAYLWIVPVEADGWVRRELASSEDGMEVVVVRLRAAIGRFRVE